MDPAEVKILRHGKLGWTQPYEAWQTDRATFEGYQSRQGSSTLRQGGVVAGFAVNREGKTVFVGLYNVGGSAPTPLGDVDPLVGHVHTDGKGWTYDLTHDDRLANYEDRLVIEWPTGSAGRRWDRWAGSKEWPVLEGADTELDLDRPFVTPAVKKWIRAEVDTLEVEGLGLAVVKEHLRSLGWTVFSDVREVRDVKGKKLGYDLLAQRPGQELHVELKATSGLYQPDVTLTANEKDVAERDPLWVLALATDVRRTSAKVEWMSRRDAIAFLTATEFRADLTQGSRHTHPMEALD